MVYSLANGVHNYNDRLHYSLYGGVEFLPDRTLAFKELLPLAAIPAVAITLLVAILNFHIPKIAPQTGAGTAGTGESKTTSTSLSVPATGVGSGSKGQTTPSSSTTTARTSSTPPTGIIPGTNVGPVNGGSDNGQGILGGRGGDSGTPATNPVTSLGATTPVGSASVSTNAASQPTNSQTTVNASVPLTGTDMTLSL